MPTWRSLASKAAASADTSSDLWSTFKPLVGTMTMEKRLHVLKANGGLCHTLEDEMMITKTLNKYNSGGDDLQILLQLKNGGRYERQVMEDSKCVIGERSRFGYSCGTQPSEWVKLNEFSSTGLPQRYLLFCAGRQKTDASTLREIQDNLDKKQIVKEWTDLLNKIFEHHVETLVEDKFKDYKQGSDAMALFDTEWNELETTIQEGENNFDAQPRLTALGKQKDVILGLPAIFTAVCQAFTLLNSENEEEEKWCTTITASQQGFANDISRFCRGCYMAMMGAVVHEGGTTNVLSGKEIRLRAVLLLPGKILSLSAMRHKKLVLPGECFDPKKGKPDLVATFKEVQARGLGELKDRKNNCGKVPKGATKQDFYKLAFNESNADMKAALLKLNIERDEYEAAFEREIKFGPHMDPPPRPSTSKPKAKTVESSSKARPGKRLRENDKSNSTQSQRTPLGIKSNSTSKEEGSNQRTPLGTLKPNVMSFTPKGDVNELSLDLTPPKPQVNDDSSSDSADSDFEEEEDSEAQARRKSIPGTNGLEF